MWHQCMECANIAECNSHYCSSCFVRSLACFESRPGVQNLTRQACRQGTSTILPGSFPPLCPLDWGWRGGLAFIEMNGWRNQNLNRLYCAGASKGAVARQQLWSWGKRGGGGSCSCPHKKTLAHRCEDMRACGQGQTVLCTHNNSLIHRNTHAASFYLMAICVYTRG